MFVVLFDVVPRGDRWDDYLGIAALLRPELEAIDGFVENTRYRSRSTPGRVLSLSLWRDEKALVRWRSHGLHHLKGQRPGRAEVFADYRLRVGETVEGADRFDLTAAGPPAVTIERWPDASAAPEQPDSASRQSYDALTSGERLVRTEWASVDEAAAHAHRVPAGGTTSVVRVIRDYGMRDRVEAPQYLPDVP